MDLFCVCVVLCIGSGLRRAYHSSKESYRMCKKMITELKKRPEPCKGCKTRWKKMRHEINLSQRYWIKLGRGFFFYREM
jgi:hypothetical protein